MKEDTHKNANPAPETEKTAQNDILAELEKDDFLTEDQPQADLPDFSLEDVLAEFSGGSVVEKSESQPDVVEIQEPVSIQIPELETEEAPETEAAPAEKADEDEDVLVWPAPKEKADPAFENPEKIADPDETMIFRNFSNNYGKDIPDAAQEAEQLQKQKDDKTIIGLLIATAILSTGIIGMLAYWLVTFLK